MKPPGPRFGYRAAPPAGGPPPTTPALRPAADTILSPRTSAGSRPAAAPRTRSALPLAMLLVAASALAFAMIRRMAMFDMMALELSRFNGIAVPLIAGVLAIMVLSGRSISRGRALASLAILAAICPVLAALGGYKLMALVTMLASGIAFVTVPIALDWIAVTGNLNAARAGATVAAAQLGMAIGNTPALIEGPGPVIVALTLLGLVTPFALIASYRGPPEPAVRPSVAATQAALGDYTALGLIAAAIIAAASTLLLAASLPSIAMGGETVAAVAMTFLLATLIALVGGGLLADRLGRDPRGYGRWFAVMLGAASLVAFYASRLELVSAGLAVLFARILPFAGLGAALALLVRVTPPAAWLGALTAFLAAQAIGATIVGRMIAGGASGLQFRAIGYGAIGLLIAAAVVVATMPKRNRA